ncbi:MAG: hypothetical protein AAGD25_27980 [Cyanobacteria bacterium P01_F01_bin.150]
MMKVLAASGSVDAALRAAPLWYVATIPEKPYICPKTLSKEDEKLPKPYLGNALHR